MLPSAWRYKQFHISYLLSWLGLGVLGGIMLGQVWSGPIAVTVPIAVALLVGSFRSRRWQACVLVVVGGLLLGTVRASTFSEQLRSLDVYVGQTVTLQGSLSQDPVQKGDTTLWQVQLHKVMIGNTSHVGEVYATVASDEVLRRGDRVEIRAKAGDGFGNFQLSFYRAELVYHQRAQDIFLDARDRFAEAVRSVMPEPEASLGLGFVVGQKSALPDDLVEQLKIVGLTHIVVASGYNLTILVRFARRLLSRRSRYLALVGSVVLVAGFVMISGFSPSMNRAAIVTGLSLLAWYYGRQFHPVQLILYVASVSAFLYPVYLWSDLGWLLSFAAFTGVLVVAPIVNKILWRKRDEPPAVGQMVVETLSAELMTLPIIMVSFGYIPIFGLLANMLVAPVIPLAMAATFVAGLAGLVSPVLAILAMPASIIIAYVVSVVTKLSSVPWAQVTTEAAPIVAAVWYGLLGAWTMLLWRSHRIDLRASSVVD